MNAADFFAQLRAQPTAAPALVTADVTLDYRALLEAVDALADSFRSLGVRVLATELDNGASWVIADLAALAAGVAHVPLPQFFTPAQRDHVLAASGADALLAHDPSTPGATQLLPLRCACAAPLPAGTAKITFTSGTSGQPKGACLAPESMFAVASGLARALAPLGLQRHLCALPLAVLLENVAGVYAPLLAGGCTIVLPVTEVGLTGSSRFEPARLDVAALHYRADSVITLPQMLRLWTGWRAAHELRDSTLRFVAVGGAAVGAQVIAQARAVGLPAYEGYGLSEGASVQTLNLPHAERPGSAGRPLPHARVRIGRDGEVEVAGSTMLGYLGDSGVAPQWWPTGDLGEIDDDGFLHLRGRRKNVLITAFGRNVAPEWVETQLQSRPEIAHAVVFGDGAPALAAVLWPSRADLTDTALERAVVATNAALPDYARIAHWVRGAAPFDASSGLATFNGRPRRRDIERRHAAALAAGFTHERTRVTFFDRLQSATAAERAALIQVPVIQSALRGDVSLPSYIAFLTEAYHHVRHTVPLLAACRARLPQRRAWMQPALDAYIAEEAGHDDWILADLAACGADAEAVRNGRPGAATEIMVAYAYDTIARGNPVGFLGMVHVLEGTSVALALAAADRIQRTLDLPDAAFGYLRSHGTLDREHVHHFAQLVNRIDDAGDQQAVIHAARMFYRLYGDVFRALPLPVFAAEAVA